MLLLSCNDLERGFDAGPLFRGVGFELHAGERVGLVGPNGVGKTTLKKILAGLDRPDAGDVRHHAGARVALLRQLPDFAPERTLFAEARTAMDELLGAHEDMIRTAEALAAATDETARKSLSARYDRLHELLRHHRLRKSRADLKNLRVAQLRYLQHLLLQRFDTPRILARR